MIVVLKLPESEQIAAVEDRLVKQFTDVPADTVRTTVAAAHQHFIESAVRDYIALLVERRAFAALKSAAPAS
ncbi:three-helix bundle dimerization domain-containing protein [Mycolicibacterium sp. A43C]